jgi:hypothetical protein
MRMKKEILATIAVMLCVAAMVARALFVEKRATVARITDAQIGDVRVLGESDDRFEGWAFYLYWRKDGGPWMEYLIDRQVGFWRNVKLERKGEDIEVRKRERTVGVLNVVDGCFSNAVRGWVACRPDLIVMSIDPSDRSKRIYPENPGWNEECAKAIRGNDVNDLEKP